MRRTKRPNTPAAPGRPKRRIKPDASSEPGPRAIVAAVQPPTDIELKPSTYQPSKAEQEETQDMPGCHWRR